VLNLDQDNATRQPPARKSAPIPLHERAEGLEAPASFAGGSWLVLVLDAIIVLVIFQVCLSLRTGVWDLGAVMDVRLWGIWSALVTGLYLSDCYQFDRHFPGLHLPVRTIIVTLVTGLLVGLGAYLLGPAAMMASGYTVLSRSILIPAFPLLAVIIAVTRWMIQRRLRAGAMGSRWLVLGASRSEALAHLYRTWQKGGCGGEMRILVSDCTISEPFPLAGQWSALAQMLERPWTGIILTGGWQLPGEVIERLMIARLTGVRIFDLGDYYERFLHKLPIYHLDHGWLTLTSGFDLLHDRLSVRVKRVGDLLVAGSMLVMGLPFMIGIYSVVRLTSRGPGFFTQPRVGIGGRVFTCYKFRSMVIGSDAGNMYTAANDPRITAIGAIMRRTRFDELPQLWNVLRGDMSFIGPRAEWSKCVVDYEKVIPFYHLRHLVRPGLTGWAQVNYPYGASIDDAREKLEYDLYYLKNQSLLLDVIILLRTVRVVLQGKGAR
jgi:exopolysaccharide biosynthesis polyprenyl glycosylphosphotransferase